MLAATALAAPLTPAWAACTPASAPGVTATCTGSTLGSTGYGNGQDDVTVNVVPGATLTGTNTGIFLGLNTTVDNRGSIEGAIDAVNADTINLSNSGSIIGTVGASVVTNAIDSLSNSGSMQGGIVGVTAQFGGIQSLVNSGSITGGSDGIRASDTIQSLYNSGSITGTTGDGILALSDIASLTNTSTGTITGDDSGIDADTITTLTNSGLIHGDAFGVAANTITSLTNTSSGTISGDFIGMAADRISTLLNSGTISAASSQGISAGTIDNLTNTSTGKIIASGIRNSNGIDALTINSLSNDGIIRSETGSGMIVVTLGSLTNGSTGSISGHTGVNTAFIGTLTNSGSITGEVFGVAGQFSIGTLNNSGRIVGENIYGIVTVDAGSINNSGSIIGGDTGIYIDNSIESLTNSGLIAGEFAIQERGAADDSTLTLLAGSVLIGKIDLGGGVDTLNVGNGLSIMNTFEGAAPVIGTTNGSPYAVRGNQVAVVDPTNLANADEMLVDLTDSIFSTLQGRLSGLRSGFTGTTQIASAGAGGFAPPMALGMRPGSDGDTAAAAPTLRGQYWAQGFAARRDQVASSPSVGSEQRLAGFISGLDAPVSASTVAGFFFGASWADTDADFNSQSTDADSVFGGLYASALWGASVIDIAIVGGRTDFDRSRRVANNLAPNGIEIAAAGYDGWFISPEARLTQPLARIEGQRLEGIVSLRYAGLFTDGFAENGSAGALAVGDRDVHLGVARAGLALPLEHKSGATLARLVLSAGAEGRTQFGDKDVSGVLLGQGIEFNPGGDDSVIGVYAGAEAQVVTGAGSTAFAAFEGLAEDDGSHRASGKAGVRLSF